MQVYLNLLQEIIDHGHPKMDRTGTGTKSIFGYQMRFNVREKFPLLTTKKVHTRSIIHELLWFLKGETHVSSLQQEGVKIWDEWATAEQTAKFNRKAGDLGPVYGHQWRNFGATKDEQGNYKQDGIDQIQHIINQIRENPDSRRLIVSGWNPQEANQVALPPCHTLFQFYVANGELSCHLYQRSGDVFLGVPFNIASYTLLTYMMAQVCDLKPGDFVHSFGDVHLYDNHIEQAKLQLSRKPKELPTLHLNPEVKNLFDFKYEDIEIKNYDPHAVIKAPVAV